MSDQTLTNVARDLRGLIEANADETDANCTMSKHVVDAIEETGLFRLSIPEEIGGLEADPDTIIDVCEAISYADGATGWAFTQNTITGSYLAYTDPESARPFAERRAWAGHFAPLGMAHEVDGGYRVSGSWQFASGSGHADVMGGAAVVLRDGAPIPLAGGRPLIVGFFVPAEVATLKGNWDTLGLRGTGSFDYEIPETFVETGATFPLELGYVPEHSGGTAYSLGPQAHGTIGTCAWALGVASRAMDEIADIAKAGRSRMGNPPLREQTGFQRDFGFHRVALDGARLHLRSVYRDAIDLIERGAPTEECSAVVRSLKAHSNYVVKGVAKPATVWAWEMSGSTGMRNPSVIQRCFRDMQVGAGHAVFDDRYYSEHAKPALDLEPAPF